MVLGFCIVSGCSWRSRKRCGTVGITVWERLNKLRGDDREYCGLNLPLMQRPISGRQAASLSF